LIILEQISVWISYLPIYFANGLLAICYWLAGQFPLLVSLSGAAGIAFLLDQEMQLRAGYLPAREGHSARKQVPHTAELMTAFVAILWMIAQWGMAEPVPWLGAFMWVSGFLVVLALPAHRFNLLWYVKAGIAIYALCVIGSRLYLHYTMTIQSNEWLGVLGNSSYSEYFIQNTQSNVTSILIWLLWLVVPLGYFSLLVQQLFINPMSLMNPFSSVQEMIGLMRDRKGRHL